MKLFLVMQFSSCLRCFATMNTRTIIVIAACLASVKGSAQLQDSSASSPYVNVQYTNFRNHNHAPMFGTMVWLETVEAEMCIDDKDGAFEFSCIDTDMSFKLRGDFPAHRFLKSNMHSEITFLLQDGSTFEARNTGIGRKMNNGSGVYQCTFGFSMDTNQLKRFIKTGIKSGRLHTPDGYYNLKVSANAADKIRRIAADFLRVYIKRVIIKHSRR